MSAEIIPIETLEKGMSMTTHEWWIDKDGLYHIERIVIEIQTMKVPHYEESWLDGILDFVFRWVDIVSRIRMKRGSGT